MPAKSSHTVRVFYPVFNQDQVIQQIRSRLKALQEKLPLQLVALFGSYAKGNYTVASDIDLLVIYHGKQREDAFALCKKILSLPRLEPHTYSTQDYKAMKPTIDRMIKDGIILFPPTKDIEP